MKLLGMFVERPLAITIGWALLHFLWEGAIMAALLSISLLAFRSPRIRYVSACAAMLGMLAAFGATLFFLMPEAGRTLPAGLPPAFPSWSVRTGLGEGYVGTLGLAAIAPWLAPFWIAGVWIFCLRQLAGFLSISRLRRRGVCCPAGQWQEIVSQLCAQLRLSRSVQLLESCVAEVPMVIGHLRPVILMPVGLLTGLPAGQIEAILLHELAHIRRWDYLINVLQRAVEGLLFYHPAVWWISRVIRTEREHCCDDAAVAISRDPHGYALALATLEQTRWQGREPALAAAGGNLMNRVHRLLYPAKQNRTWAPFLAAFMLVATAAVATAAWRTAPLEREAAPQLRSTAATPGPWGKWLDQDVVYIISDQERTAFERLTTDEERQHFVKQFWLRRDPTPGTPENEFKEEHYRRIAFANRHFRTASGRPGWQTDRGHMYIVYGPPDEIDSHPNGASGQFAYETWLYRHIDGIGNNVSSTFVDRAKTGDYRLAPGKSL